MMTMKTRILHTRFWQDGFICQLSHKEKLLFVYLLTNDKVNIIGIYELPDKYIKADLELTQPDLNKAKSKFQKAGKIIFMNGWIKIVNADKYNSYRGEKLQKARDRELSEAPEELIGYQGGIDTSIDTSIDTPNNHKSKTINHKSIIINQKTLKSIAQKYDVPLAFVKSKYEDLKDYCKSTGKTYKDYSITLKRWVKRDGLKIKQDYAKQNNEVAL